MFKVANLHKLGYTSLMPTQEKNTVDILAQWKQRIGCGDQTALTPGNSLLFMGWVDAYRDHGSLLFIHLRDRTGIIQIVFDAEKDADLYARAKQLKTEYVIAVRGVLQKRMEGAENPHIPTGSLELPVSELTIFQAAETPPFLISEKDMFGNREQSHQVDEDIRLRYRYLDLRRPSMQEVLAKRSEAVYQIRQHLYEAGFTDVETPILTKSTPEGARDYVVPSRVHHGQFYALPQSPQLFKQLLMMSGVDRYYQITKCFRDEDLRPNRQPEFTQVDLEASFIDESYIYDLIEGLITRIATALDVPMPAAPFPRISYADAMSKYGTDAPDLRFDMQMHDCTDIMGSVNYKIFQMILEKKGRISGMRIPGQAEHMSKNLLQNELAMKTIQKLGGKGLTWMKYIDGRFESNIVQFFTEEELENVKQRLGVENGDVIVFVADTDPDLVLTVLGRFRSYIAERQGLIPEGVFAPCWVVDFPLFEKKDGQLTSLHHPFTRANDTISAKTDEASLVSMTARAYDLVINGEEVGGGSLRIDNAEEQKEVFKILGMSEEAMEDEFGFFIKALGYGCPPHGGLALGLDRLMSIFLNRDSIRDVIPFPKNRTAHCPLTDAPSNVSTQQLIDLNLKVTGEA